MVPSCVLFMVCLNVGYNHFVPGSLEWLSDLLLFKLQAALG